MIGGGRVGRSKERSGDSEEGLLLGVREGGVGGREESGALRPLLLVLDAARGTAIGGETTRGWAGEFKGERKAKVVEEKARWQGGFRTRKGGRLTLDLDADGSGNSDRGSTRIVMMGVQS
jgi:hypothetical protein